ncbi:putative ABC transporter permease protein [Candidatus Promineifilum breve]|uniref:ABC transporter permease protein n=1 Tax=Candidatus Promineifilum breve TaxID=1806508 RepID=A0A160T622_9CHLR|nr:putative ABC transporter permease protein [Candidatus Promineifilum breve]
MTTASGDRQKRRWGRWVIPLGLMLLPVGFFILFYFYPLGAILRLGLLAEGRLNTAALTELFSSSYLLRVLWFTTWQAVVSTALTLLLAFPGAYVMARYRFRGKSLVRAVATLPFVLPTVVVAAAFLALIGPSGVINSWLRDVLALESAPLKLDQTVWIILLAHVFYNYSIALRILSAYWQNLPPSLSQAAQMLGASPPRAFVAVTLPLLRPAITAAATLIFIFCFTSFGVIVILGGPRFATLEVEIYRQALNLFNLPLAAALSLWQILFTLILMAVYTRTQARIARPIKTAARAAVERPPRSPREKALVAANVVAIVGLIGAPLLALAARSLRGENGLTLTYYGALFTNRDDSLFFVPPGAAILNSVAIALAAMTLSVGLALIAAQAVAGWERSATTGRGGRAALARLLDVALMLPLATSAVTLGLGYLIALGRPPLNLRTSILILPIAHAVVAIPFVLRSILPGFRAILPSLREAAAMLGANGRQVWREVDWPLVRRPVLVGALFAFTISLGEFGATVFLARPETPTLPVAIYRFLGRPGALNYGQALAMSTLLMLVCAVAFVAIEHFRFGDEGEF